MQTKTISIFSVLIILSFSLLIIRAATEPIGNAKTAGIVSTIASPVKAALCFQQMRTN